MLQKQYSIPFRGSKTPQLPPLRPTVPANPGASDCDSPAWLKDSLNLTEEFADEASTMGKTGNKQAPKKDSYLSDSQIAGLAKDHDTTNYKVSKRGWEKVLATIKKLREQAELAHKLEEEKEELEEQYNSTKLTNQDLVKQLADKEDFKTKYETLLAKRKKGKKGNDRKDEQKDDVKDAITTFVKDVLFRNVKFAKPGKTLTHACGLVWDGVKEKLKLEEGSSPLKSEDFAEIYDSHVLSCLSNARNYVATRSKIAADGKKNLCIEIILSKFTPNLCCEILFSLHRVDD